MTYNTKPKKLEFGDTIGIITPSEPISILKKDRFEKGTAELKVRGFKIKIGKYALLNPNNYIAANDKERAEDINEMFADSEVKAILCTAGGHNSNGILPYLDYSLIEKNPKIFVGLSDPTAIINAIYKKTGLITFHGPSVMSDYGKGINRYTEEYFGKAVMYSEPIGKIKELSNWEILKGGICEGTLIGGNLTILQCLIGTEYEPDWTDTILFWEEMGVEPFNIERKLTQLKQLGIFNKIKGMIVGKCVECETKSYNNKTTIQEVVQKVCSEFKFPIIFNVDLGHTMEKITIPLGTKAKIDTKRKDFFIIESGVM